MKIKTSELTGAALDWAVAACEGYDDWDNEDPDYMGFGSKNGEPTFTGILNYTPSSDWSLGGPIIERMEIGIKLNAPCSAGRDWEASPSITAKGVGGRWGYGPTPLIAAMRCYVASKLGDEVEIPDELLEETK